MQRPPSLPELQRAFAASLVQGDAPALTPWIATRGIDAAARLGIYRNAGYAIHVEALEAVFPVLRAFVGDASFDGLATRYAGRHGSSSGNLQHYGRDFADFVHAQPEMAAYSWLRDVARLEWLCQEALLAAEHGRTPREVLLAALQNAAAGTLYVRLQPHVRVLCAEIPVLDLWRWAQHPQAASPDPSGAAQCVLLWRQATRITMSAVDADIATFVLALQQGCDLATAAGDQADPLRVTAYLQPLVENALIADITFVPASPVASDSLP